MGQGRNNPAVVAVSAAVRWAMAYSMRWRRPPPEEVGVREPRRPKPTLPAVAVALDEPRTHVRRWIKLINLRDTDPS